MGPACWISWCSGLTRERTEALLQTRALLFSLSCQSQRRASGASTSGAKGADKGKVAEGESKAEEEKHTWERVGTLEAYEQFYDVTYLSGALISPSPALSLSFSFLLFRFLSRPSVSYSFLPGKETNGNHSGIRSAMHA